MKSALALRASVEDDDEELDPTNFFSTGEGTRPVLSNNFTSHNPSLQLYNGFLSRNRTSGQIISVCGYTSKIPAP